VEEVALSLGLPMELEERARKKRKMEEKYDKVLYSSSDEEVG